MVKPVLVVGRGWLRPCPPWWLENANWAVILDGGSAVAACALTEVNSSHDGTERAYQGVCGSVTNLARIKEQHGVPARGGMKCESETEKGPRASPVT